MEIEVKWRKGNVSPFKGEDSGSNPLLRSIFGI